MTAITRAHFEAQSSPTACVTACGCMALRARGQRPDQHALHIDSSACGRAFDDLCTIVAGATRLHDTDLLGRIHLELVSGRSLAVEVQGRRWMYLPPVLRARDLSHKAWTDEGEFLHAVVLYGLEAAEGRLMPEDEYLCLDPFFPAGAQPLRLSEDALRAVCLRAIVF